MPMTTYLPTIGIEVHAELKTKSKMFCGCKNDPHASEVNANVCPICLAHPGTLPRVNMDAVRKVLLVGKALNGKLADYSEFDRKNYFYPDIPKAYQLSQYAFPFVGGGKLAGVEITRVHLEEDTARSQHDGSESLVDFNRAGVPLMELVTEPVIHDAEGAGKFARELQLLLRTLGVSDANMEKGEMRVEANISISKTDELGTKVEVKNLNSFKSVEQSILFEIKRQTELLDKGEVVKQETRGWDETKSKTFSQRAKESADDYRYFPDPDIPKFKIGEVEEFNNSRLEEIMPILPSKIRELLLAQNIKDDQIETLLQSPVLKSFFDESVSQYANSANRIRLTANYLTSDIVGIMQSDNSLILDNMNAISFASLVSMVDEGDITSRVAKNILQEVVFDGLDPKIVAQDRGLLQTDSAEDLQPLVDKILRDNPSVVEEYKGGKESSIQFFIGQAMKETKGTANPAVLTKLFRDSLAK